MKLYYDAAYGLLFICDGLGIGYFDAYRVCKDNVTLKWETYQCWKVCK